MAGSKCISLLAAALLTVPPAVAAEINEGLIAWYPFDEGAADKTGNFESLESESILPILKGKFGGAVKLDGDTFIAIPVDLGPDLIPSITISLWVKTDPRPTDAELEAQLPNQLYIVSESIAVGNLKNDSTYFYGEALNHSIVGPKHTARRGQWQHVALVRTIEDRPNADGEIEPQVVARFHSGGRVSELVMPFRGQGMATDLYLGTNSPRYPYRFRGALDDLRIYDRALSQDEIGLLAKAKATSFPGDNFDNPNTAFPGDNFDIPTEVFPGDNFSGGETEFPGDNFEGADQGSPDSSRTTDTSALNNVNFGELSSGGIAVDNPTDHNRNAAAPVTTLPSGDGNPSVISPNQNLDDFQDRMDDPDFQDSLTAVDWNVKGMIPLTQEEKASIYPGSTVTVKIRVDKDDPANKIPDVKLAIKGAQSRAESVPLRVVTSEQAPTARRDIPMTITVPADFVFGQEGEIGTYYADTWLLTANGMPLQDTITDNNSRRLSIQVQRPPEIEDCGGTVVNDDGTRTAGGCLDSGDPPSLSGLGYNVQIKTDDVSGDFGSIVETHSFYQDQALLSGLITFERNDKPCKVEIAGRVLGDASRLEKSFDNCKDKSSDNRIGIDSVLPETIDSGFGITGIQVCFSFQSERVKGIRAYGGRINATGTLQSTESKFDLHERPNCTRWQDPAWCSSGSVATGIILHFRDGNIFANIPFLVGIQLICSELKETSS